MTVAYDLTLPLDHPKLLELTAGTRVAITGTIITAGAEAHRQLDAGAPLPEDLPEGTILFHCRPELKRRGRHWDAVSVEPEISASFEPSLSAWLSHRRIRGFLGYGGFGESAFQHFRRFTGCYFQTYAGAGPALAEFVTTAREIPFGKGLKGPDAMWALDVVEFPAILTMDFEGSSLHRLLREGSGRKLASLVD